MREWLLVGVGGGLGAIARHALNGIVRQSGIAAEFPAGIFIVNVTGSFAIGLLAGLLVSARLNWSTDARTFVIVGLLGGFTTFSSFSLDVLNLFRAGHVGLAVLNAAGQVVLSLLAVAVGFRIGAA